MMRKRITSLLLCLVMALSLLPTTVFAEDAIGSGTASDHHMVYTWEQFKAAMKDPSIDYVEIAQDITHQLEYITRERYEYCVEHALWGQLTGVDIVDGWDVAPKVDPDKPGNVAVLVNGTKHLVLSHDLIIPSSGIPNDDNRKGMLALFFLKGNADLTIEGTETIDCFLRHNFDNSYVFMIGDFDTTGGVITDRYSANLTINGGNIIARHSYYTKANIVKLFCGNVTVNSGTMRIRGSRPGSYTFYNQNLLDTNSGSAFYSNYTPSVFNIDFVLAWKDFGYSKLTINGGNFGMTDDSNIRVPVIGVGDYYRRNESNEYKEILLNNIAKVITINGGILETGITYWYSQFYFDSDMYDKLLGENCESFITTSYKDGYNLIEPDSRVGEMPVRPGEGPVEIQKVVVSRKNHLVLDYGERVYQNGGYARAEIGSIQHTATAIVEAGSEVTINPVPLKNYVFDHWELSSNITLTEGSTTSETIKFTMPNADATVKPVFKKITYSISYNLNGGSWNGTAGVGEYEAESEVTLPTNVTKSGYDFLGWYEHEGAYWYGPYDKITAYDSGNKTFTAKWKTSADAEFPIKVRIDNTAGRTDKGATVALDKAAAAGGETVTVQVNVKDGYTLDSVSIAKVGGRSQITLNDLGNGKYTFTMPSDFSNTSTNYAEITVKTTKNTYNINWNLNGGEKAGSSWGDEVYYRSTYTVTDYGFDMPKNADVKKEGYKLVGWYTNSACTGEPVVRHEQGETGNKTYYAKWEKDTYTVKGGQIGNGKITVDKAAGQMGDTVTVTVMPYEGYKMKSGSLQLQYYDVNNQFKRVPITGNTFNIPGGDVQLYAEFEKDPDYEFGITVTGGTASLGAGNTITKAKEGTVVKLNTTVPEGKTFKEWEVVIGNTTITNATSATDASFTMPFGRVEINAVFEDAAPALTPITNVAATVTAPAIGAHPDFSATAVTTPDGGVNTVSVTEWVKMAKADYLAGSSDWITLTSTDVFETGYYYGVAVTVTAKDGYSFTASTTGTVNGDDLFAMSRRTEDTVKLDYVFEPLTGTSKAETPEAVFTANGPDTGKLTNVDSDMEYRINSSAWIDITDTEVDLTGLSACDIYVVRKGDGTTTVDSDAQHITVTKATTPTGITSAACTAAGSDDGELKNVSATMEYKKSDAAAWTDGTGSDITGLSAGIYYVRTKASGTELASEYVSVTVAVTGELGGSVTIDGIAKYDKPLTANTDALVGNTGTLSYQWKRNGADISGATNSTYYLTEDDIGEIITVAVTDSGASGTITSAGVTPEKADGPAAPTGLTGVACTTSENNDGKITGVTTAMEYSSASDFSVKTTCTDTEITGLPNGTYYVRVAETTTHKAGAVATVTIAAYTAPTEYTITFDGNGGTPSVPTMRTKGGKLASLPSATRSGSYSFDDWYTAASGGTKITRSYVFFADTIVYAHWTYIGGSSSGSVSSSYVITVKDAKNGDVTADRRSASAGTTVTITVKPDSGYVLDDLTVTDAKDKTIKLTDKGNGKYTFTMPSSKVTVEASFSEIKVENPFVDVKPGSYYEDAVIWAVGKGITGGTSATTFDPNATCNRAQAVTFLWRAAGSPAPKSTTMPFTDVPVGSYYYDAVLWAVENGITNGTSATTFGPNASCNRAQIVTFLWRAQKSPAATAANPFTDVAADAYYTNAVLWAVKEGVTAGTTATTFSPAADCTRAQIVTFIYRALAD